MITLGIQASGSKASNQVQIFTYPLFFLGTIWMMRRAWRQRTEMRTSLANFSVRNANCFNEADRKIVYDNIAEMMRFSFGLPPTTSQDEALIHFDLLVRYVLQNPGYVNCGYEADL